MPDNIQWIFTCDGGKYRARRWGWSGSHGRCAGSRSVYPHRHGLVDGWLSQLDALAIASIDRAQQKLGVDGPVGEIGIHHGKLFILLAMLLRGTERGMAIDLFGDQNENLDLSGFGDEAVLHRNLARFRIDEGRITIKRANSLELNWEMIAAGFGGPARLFSVDGGHRAENAEHDLAIAEAGLAPGGVVIIDDYFNAEWPAVSEGVNRFMLSHEGALHPFGIGDNKIFMSRPDHAPRYREQLESELPQSRFLRRSEMFGADVAIFRTPRSLLQRLRQSQLIREMRGHPAARALQPVVRRLLKIG